VLDDGTYEAIVVDAEDLDGGALGLEITIIAGEHKGEVVTVRAEGLGRDSLDLLAVPATLTVADGEPTVALEA
jgi:hypothetical protein